MDIFCLHFQSTSNNLQKSDYHTENSSGLYVFRHCAYDLKCFVIFVFVFIVIAIENDLTRSSAVKQNRKTHYLKQSVSSVSTKHYLEVYLQYVNSYS